MAIETGVDALQKPTERVVAPELPEFTAGTEWSNAQSTWTERPVSANDPSETTTATQTFPASSESDSTATALELILQEREASYEEEIRLVANGELKVETLMSYSPNSLFPAGRFKRTLELIEQSCPDLQRLVKAARFDMEFYGMEPVVEAHFWERVIAERVGVPGSYVQPTQIRLLRITDKPLDPTAEAKYALFLVVDYNVQRHDPPLVIPLSDILSPRLRAIIDIANGFFQDITELLVEALRYEGHPSVEKALVTSERLLTEFGRRARSHVMRFIIDHILTDPSMRSVVGALNSIANP